jgi:hypothetical protein
MMSAAMFRPIACSRDQPNISAARSFQSAVAPSDFTTTTAAHRYLPSELGQNRPHLRHSDVCSR